MPLIQRRSRDADNAVRPSKDDPSKSEAQRGSPETSPSPVIAPPAHITPIPPASLNSSVLHRIISLFQGKKNAQRRLTVNLFLFMVTCVSLSLLLRQGANMEASQGAVSSDRSDIDDKRAISMVTNPLFETVPGISIIVLVQSRNLVYLSNILGNIREVSECWSRPSKSYPGQSSLRVVEVIVVPLIPRAHPGDYESDGFWEMLSSSERSFPSFARVLSAMSSMSVSQAINVAVPLTRGKAVIVMDHRCYFMPGSLEEVVSAWDTANRHISQRPSATSSKNRYVLSSGAVLSGVLLGADTTVVAAGYTYALTHLPARHGDVPIEDPLSLFNRQNHTVPLPYAVASGLPLQHANVSFTDTSIAPALSASFLLFAPGLFTSLNGYNEIYTNSNISEVDYATCDFCLRLHMEGGDCMLSAAATIGYHRDVDDEMHDPTHAHSHDAHVFSYHWSQHLMDRFFNKHPTEDLNVRMSWQIALDPGHVGDEFREDDVVRRAEHLLTLVAAAENTVPLMNLQIISNVDADDNGDKSGGGGDRLMQYLRILSKQLPLCHVHTLQRLYNIQFHSHLATARTRDVSGDGDRNSNANVDQPASSPVTLTLMYGDPHGYRRGGGESGSTNVDYVVVVAPPSNVKDDLKFVDELWIQSNNLQKYLISLGMNENKLVLFPLTYNRRVFSLRGAAEVPALAPVASVFWRMFASATAPPFSKLCSLGQPIILPPRDFILRPHSSYNLLYIHSSSSSATAALSLLVKSFLMEFSESDDIALVILTSSATYSKAASDIQKLRETMPGEKAPPLIRVISNVSVSRLPSLFTVVNATVLLTHDDRSKQRMLEMMAMNIPILVPDWLSMMDVLSSTSSPSAFVSVIPVHDGFSLPLQEHLNRALRSMLTNAATSRAKANLAQQLLYQQLSYSNLASLLNNRIRVINEVVVKNRIRQQAYMAAKAAVDHMNDG